MHYTLAPPAWRCAVGQLAIPGLSASCEDGCCIIFDQGSLTSFAYAVLPPAPTVAFPARTSRGFFSLLAFHATFLSPQKKLRERHGRMEEMRLYKESPSADCELTNEMLTLEQAGIEGAPKNEVPVKVCCLVALLLLRPSKMVLLLLRSL